MIKILSKFWKDVFSSEELTLDNLKQILTCTGREKVRTKISKINGVMDIDTSIYIFIINWLDIDLYHTVYEYMKQNELMTKNEKIQSLLFQWLFFPDVTHEGTDVVTIRKYNTINIYYSESNMNVYDIDVAYVGNILYFVSNLPKIEIFLRPIRDYKIDTSDYQFSKYRKINGLYILTNRGHYDYIDLVVYNDNTRSRDIEVYSFNKYHRCYLHLKPYKNTRIMFNDTDCIAISESILEFMMKGLHLILLGKTIYKLNRYNSHRAFEAHYKDKDEINSIIILTEKDIKSRYINRYFL